MGNKRLGWKFGRETKILSTPVLDLYQADAVRPGSKLKHRFTLLEVPDWCNVIPVTEDGKVILIRQFRAGIRAVTLEIPGGIVDPGDRSARHAAIRELGEETGYVLAPGARVERLGWSYPNPAIQNNRVHLFVAGPVRKLRAQHLDPTEAIEITPVPLARIPKLIREGKISHALMLNAFFLAMLRFGGLESFQFSRRRAKTRRKRLS